MLKLGGIPLKKYSRATLIYLRLDVYEINHFIFYMFIFYVWVGQLSWDRSLSGEICLA